MVFCDGEQVPSAAIIERATDDSEAFRFIAAKRHPGHDTLAHFRKTFLVKLEDLFVQVLAISQKQDQRCGICKSPASRPPASAMG